MRTVFAALALAAAPLSSLHAEGVLNLYNWGNYTSPEMIEKFEKAHNVDVTITDYDSNDTALAKIRAGGHGFDMVVPSASVFPIWINEGLVQEHGLTGEPEFKNIDPRWVDVAFDPGRKFSIPWVWGTTGVLVNTKMYTGPADSWSLLFDPPEELRGKINVIPEMSDVIPSALRYIGATDVCTEDRDTLRKLRDTLVTAKAHWASLDYGTIEKYAKGDFAAGMNWSGATLRARIQNPDIKYVYPKEGLGVWMDNLAILKDAQNVENAKLFMKFLLDAENSAMNTNFNGYPSGITGAENFYKAEFKGAPEMSIPDGVKAEFQLYCGDAVNQLHAKIWGEVTQ